MFVQPTKRALKRCLDRVIAECADKPTFIGKPLADYCAQGNHLACLQVLADMKVVHLAPSADGSPCPRWVSVCKGARSASFRMGAERRDKLVSFFLGVLSGALVALFTAWVTGSLRL